VVKFQLEGKFSLIKNTSLFSAMALLMSLYKVLSQDHKLTALFFVNGIQVNKIDMFYFSIGLVASSSDLAPSFTWSEDETSGDGIPFLIVNFPEGEIDAAILKRFNPIPMRPDESDQDIDNCIFEGFLEKESSVYVTVTGGCPFSNSFEVTVFCIIFL
jgi:hypothetical protein